jgi:hypothetical protein
MSGAGEVKSYLRDGRAKRKLAWIVMTRCCIRSSCIKGASCRPELPKPLDLVSESLDESRFICKGNARHGPLLMVEKEALFCGEV